MLVSLERPVLIRQGEASVADSMLSLAAYSPPSLGLPSFFLTVIQADYGGYGLGEKPWLENLVLALGIWRISLEASIS